MSTEQPPALLSSQEPVVLVVDDDASMRASLRRLLTVAGIAVELYPSGKEFLAEAKFDRPGCLLLDISMPAMSGLEVQASLNQRGVSLPVIFLTGSADIPIAVTAMREGAVDFVEKPFQNDDLLARVRQAIAHHHRHWKNEEERQVALQRLATLTPREHEVLELVVVGKTNKEIARVLGASHRTIEIHRVHLMEKMMAATLADLVRMRLLAGDKATSGEVSGGERVDAP
jgi:FixJ family two-component response regulator